MGFLGEILKSLFGGGAGGGLFAKRPPRTAAPRIGGTKLPKYFADYGYDPGTGEWGDLRRVPFSEGFVGRFLGLRRKRLCYLAYHHPQPYRVHSIPKHDGTERLLHEPVPQLKFAQRRILKRLLDRVELHPAAHGFRPRRSIVTNAREHVGQELVVGLDIRDFFPSITYARVYGVFRSLELEKREAALMARLTTHEGALPQGAPTSPAIANIVCRRLDRRLAGLAKRAGARYTRYADDVTLSGPRDILSILPVVRRIISEEGFGVHPRKTRIMGRGARQQVTGLVVNDKVSVPRDARRKLRALVHNIKTRGGLSAPDVPPGLREHLVGHASYLGMVDPAKGERMLSEIVAL